MSAPMLGWLGVQCFELARLLVVVLPAGFEMKLPAVAADGHLHDLRGPFVNPGDANVALDLFHHVFMRVTVTAQRLDTGISRQITGFRRHVLGNGAFGV